MTTAPEFATTAPEFATTISEKWFTIIYFSSLLLGLISSTNLDIGVWIHRCLNRLKLVTLTVRLSTSLLLDMYAKCGNLKFAKRLFDSIINLAELAAEKVLQLDNHIHGGVYVLLSNLYASSGKHSDASFIACWVC